jgi:predicted permease
MQLALGASRGRLVSQLFLESVILSSVGAALGVVGARLVADLMVTQLSSPGGQVALDVPLDERVFAFTAAVSAATAIIFGVAPALRVRDFEPVDVLRTGGLRLVSGHRRGMRSLVAVQVALSVVLLVGAGLFLKSLTALSSRPLGFEPERVIVALMDAQNAKIVPDESRAIYRRITDAVGNLPNVRTASVSVLTPLGGGGLTPPLEIARRGRITIRSNQEVSGNLVSPGWLETFDIPLLAGRDFSDSDNDGAESVIIVNQAFVSRYLGATPLGATVTIYPSTPRAFAARVIGVAGDTVSTSIRDAAPPAWYVPFEQLTAFPVTNARLSVRIRSGDPASMTRSVVAAIASVNPRIAVTPRVLSEQVRASMALDRLMAQLASGFGLLALLLAALGVYGVTAYTVSQERAAIGVRLALGAIPNSIARDILGSVLRTTAAGAVVGLAISAWTVKSVSLLLYRVEPRDLMVFATVPLVLLLVGVASAWLPARRAANTNLAGLIRST